jgi:hypothetical protein
VLAKADSDAVQQKESQRDKNTTKDDIARLLHLFKEPMAQCHWNHLNGNVKGSACCSKGIMWRI